MSVTTQPRIRMVQVVPPQYVVHIEGRPDSTDGDVAFLELRYDEKDHCDYWYCFRHRSGLSADASSLLVGYACPDLQALFAHLKANGA